MQDYFERLKEFKKLVQISYPNISEDEIILAVDHIARHIRGERKNLSDQERVIYSILLKWGVYKPKGLYNVIYIWRYPSHIQDLLKRGEITLKKAIELHRDYKIKTDDQREAEIRQDILKAIMKLPDYYGGEVA